MKEATIRALFGLGLLATMTGCGQDATMSAGHNAVDQGDFNAVNMTMDMNAMPPAGSDLPALHPLPQSKSETDTARPKNMVED